MMIPDQATIESPSLDEASTLGEQAFSVQAQSAPSGPTTQIQSLQPSPSGRVSPSTQIGSGFTIGVSDI